jgi:acetyltransferase-like isoleucine patch superfamily enzyme
MRRIGFDRLLRLRNLWFHLRIRFSGEWSRAQLYQSWLGSFGSCGTEVRITGRPDFGSEPYLLHFGNRVTITDGVRFLTHDGAVALFRDELPGLRMHRPITVGSNVFIGINALILPDVTIGDDCVIGAGAVVTKDVASGTVVGGNPAVPLKTVAEYRAGVMPRTHTTTPSSVDGPK